MINAYILGCRACQRNKSNTAKALGLLHPLPIPDKRFDSVVIDFIGPLPMDDRYDAIVMMTDRLGVDIQIVPCRTDMTAKGFASLFFSKWYCKNGCPLELISDCNKIFMLKFWRVLMKLMGMKHKMLTAYHPKTDGASEQTNKMVVQCL